MVQLDYTTPQINHFTGKPQLNVTPEMIEKYALKKDSDIEQYRDKLPAMTFADTVNGLFDAIPMPSNKAFAAYNNLLIDIRHAKKQNQPTIDIDKSEIDLLKTTFEGGVVSKDGKSNPRLNRQVGFVIEVLDASLITKTVES